MEYEEALREGVIASFKIAFVGTRFEPAEAAAYADLSDKLRRRKQRLLRAFDIPDEPFGEFMKAVTRIARVAGENSHLAGLYLHAFNKRRSLLSSATTKLNRLRELLPAVQAAERTIIVSQTHAAAVAAIQALDDPMPSPHSPDVIALTDDEAGIVKEEPLEFVLAAVRPALHSMPPRSSVVIYGHGRPHIRLGHSRA